jgi:5'-nucleotidase
MTPSMVEFGRPANQLLEPPGTRPLPTLGTLPVPRFLVTNDDGVQAVGLAALAAVLSELGEVTVVAPAEPLSGCSHRVTVDRPVQVRPLGQDRYAVEGTPADCVRVGLHSLAPNADWVISGINDGGNLGVDVYLSGTVAAAREAALLGCPAIALSQYRLGKTAPDWDRSSTWTRRVLQHLLGQATCAPGFWNVNFPDSHHNGHDEIEMTPCEVDLSQLPVDFHQEGMAFHYRGSYQSRSRRYGGDIDICFSGKVALSWIGLANH